jgi:hypothetical protein
VLLANPRWGRWIVKFLELSGVGRTMADSVETGVAPSYGQGTERKNVCERENCEG